MNLQAITLALATVAVAQTPPAAPQPAAPQPAAPKTPSLPTTAAQVLERALAGVERQFVPAAEAMPEDKFGYVPVGGEFAGVKTYAQQVKHIAAVNFALGAALLGEKSSVDAKDIEMGPALVVSKAEIMKYLKESFAYARKGVASVKDAELIAPIPSPFGPNQTTRLNLVSILNSHGMDHYGQMVVYLRHNGIVPPASRR